MQKKKRIGQMFFVLATCCTLNSHGRGEYCSPAKNHKVTFLIVFFSLVRKERKGKKRKELTPVSATPTHMLRICVNPRQPYYAGVQTMRARICSTFSCDMFARVVWLKPRRVAKPPILALPRAARTRHALLLATNSCTREELSKRGERSL